MIKKVYISSVALVALTFTSQMAFSMNPDEAGSSYSAVRSRYPGPDEPYDGRGQLRANEAGERELIRLRAEFEKTRAEIAQARRAEKTPEDEDRNNSRLLNDISGFRDKLENFVGLLEAEDKPVPESLYIELDALQAEAEPIHKKIIAHRRSQQTPSRSSLHRARP